VLSFSVDARKAYDRYPGGLTFPDCSGPSPGAVARPEGRRRGRFWIVFVPAAQLFDGRHYTPGTTELLTRFPAAPEYARLTAAVRR
jgi:hypothetical protein